MPSFNKAILAGTLTRDPQLRHLQSGAAVCELGMAINRSWRGQDGQQREEVTYVDLVAFGRQAETLNQYMSKGKPLLVEGRLNFEQWQAQDGSNRSKLRVVIESFQFLGNGGGGRRQQNDTGARQSHGGQHSAPGASGGTQRPAAAATGRTATDDMLDGQRDPGPPPPDREPPTGDEIPF